LSDRQPWISREAEEEELAEKKTRCEKPWSSREEEEEEDGLAEKKRKKD